MYFEKNMWKLKIDIKIKQMHKQELKVLVNFIRFNAAEIWPEVYIRKDNLPNLPDSPKDVILFCGYVIQGQLYLTRLFIVPRAQK